MSYKGSRTWNTIVKVLKSIKMFEISFCQSFGCDHYVSTSFFGSDFKKGKIFRYATCIFLLYIRLNASLIYLVDKYG